jgi:flagellar hook-basal body complex protein FliE
MSTVGFVPLIPRGQLPNLPSATERGGVGGVGGASGPSKGAGFANRLDKAVSAVSETQNHADDKLQALAAGDDVDIHGTMIALEEADISLRTMMTVRDKVVEAYQSVMNMAI